MTKFFEISHLSGYSRIFVVLSAIWLSFSAYDGYRKFPTSAECFGKKWTAIVQSDIEWDREIEAIKSKCEDLGFGTSDDELLKTIKCQAAYAPQVRKAFTNKADAKASIERQYSEDLDKLPMEQAVVILKSFMLGLLPISIAYIALVWIFAGFMNRR